MKERENGNTTRIKMLIGIVLILSVGVLLFSENESLAAPGEDPQHQTLGSSSTQRKTRASTQSPKSSKVNNLLQNIMQCRTLKQYNELLDNTKLTPSEEKELINELAKPQYTTKENRLLQDAKTAAEAEARREVDERRQQLARKQKQDLTQLNQQATQMHQRQLSQLPARAQARAPAASAGPLGSAIKKPITLEGLPHITSVSSPITPGENNLGIVGEDLRRRGEEMGTVWLKIGDVSTDLPIISYSSVAIQARVPADINDIARREVPSTLEGGVIEGRVGVRTPRGTSVAAVQLRIPIDESLLDPKIFSVFPKEIQPGQRVSILGEKFLSRRPGSVRFHFGSRTIDATVIDWAPIGILAELPPEISGMRRTVGTVEVENWVGRSDRSIGDPVTFTPVEITEELTASLEHRCSEHESWRRNEVLFDFDLTNGWRVADRHYLDMSYGTGSCFEIRRPEFGSTNPRYELSGSCSRGGRGFGADGCMCRGYVTVQGPRGLPYR